MSLYARKHSLSYRARASLDGFGQGFGGACGGASGGAHHGGARGGAFGAFGGTGGGHFALSWRPAFGVSGGSSAEQHAYDFGGTAGPAEPDAVGSDASSGPSAATDSSSVSINFMTTTSACPSTP